LRNRLKDMYGISASTKKINWKVALKNNRFRHLMFD